MRTEGRVDSRTVLTEWMEAFNERDLDGMLSRMAPGVRLYPLPLSGLHGPYRGHDGIRDWFQALHDAGHAYTIDLHEVRIPRADEVLGIGELRFPGNGETFPFWARDLIDGGLISLAHHYLTDPEMGEALPPLA